MSALNTFVPLISKKVMLKKQYWEEREALSICKQGNAFPYRESSTCEGAGHDTRGAWASRCAKLLHLLMCNSKLVICRLWLLCCPEHSHGPAVVSAAAPGISAYGDMKRLEKAAEIWIIGEPQCSHRKSLQGNSSAPPALCLLLCRFCTTTRQPIVPSFCTCPGTGSASFIPCNSVCHRGFHTSAFCPLHQLFCLPFSNGFDQLFHTSIYPRQRSHTLLSLFWLLFFLLEALLF